MGKAKAHICEPVPLRGDGPSRQSESIAIDRGSQKRTAPRLEEVSPSCWKKIQVSIIAGAGAANQIASDTRASPSEVLAAAGAVDGFIFADLPRSDFPQTACSKDLETG